MEPGSCCRLRGGRNGTALGSGTFWERPGRLGQRARNEPQLFQAVGIYFECFGRFQNHASLGVHSNVKQTPKWEQMLTMLATEVTGMAPCSVPRLDPPALCLGHHTHPEFQ